MAVKLQPSWTETPKFGHVKDVVSTPPVTDKYLMLTNRLPSSTTFIFNNYGCSRVYLGEESTGGGGDAWPPALVTLEAEEELGEVVQEVVVVAGTAVVSLSCISKRPSTRQAVA